MRSGRLPVFKQGEHKMTDKKKGIITSVIFLVFSIVMVVFARQIKPMMQNDVGSGFFPTVIGFSMCAISVLRLVMAVREKEGEAKKSGDDIKGGLETLILVGAYSSVGFIISTIVYLFLQILILTPAEKRSIPITIAISLIAPFVIYAMFVYLINTPLPKGLFGF